MVLAHAKGNDGLSIPILFEVNPACFVTFGYGRAPGAGQTIDVRFLHALKPDNYSAGSYLITVSARNASNGRTAEALIFVRYTCVLDGSVLRDVSVLHGSAMWSVGWDFKSALIG